MKPKKGVVKSIKQNNIIVFDGNTDIMNINVDNTKFIFICLHDKIYYVDTAQQKLWISDTKMNHVNAQQREKIKSIIAESRISAE